MRGGFFIHRHSEIATVRVGRGFYAPPRQPVEGLPYIFSTTASTTCVQSPCASIHTGPCGESDEYQQE